MAVGLHPLEREPTHPELIGLLKPGGVTALDPDGNLLGDTRGWVDRDGLDARSRVILMDLGNGSYKEFTQREKDSAPRFSPDGSRLAFRRPRWRC